MERFVELARFYATTNPSVDRVELFGFDCLRSNGAVFVKVHNGELVMKLAAATISALVESRRALPYRGRSGRPMKEWAVVGAITRTELIELAEESRRLATKK